jgi:3',5'-cyclic AMP phosphodiesterase CpdA
MADAPGVRLAHLSDVHISASPLGWQWRDWFSKRVTGWFNVHCLDRRWQFRDAAESLGLLVGELQQRRPDCIVFSGDATMLGFAAEMQRAANILGVDRSDMPPGFAVPGNHDYYTYSAERSGAFERYFAPWLTGQRIAKEPYPFARQVGPLWLVGVNSAVGHVLPHDATGYAGAAQLERLEKLFASLPPGLRVLVTHYPVALPDGQPEKPWHLLRDLDALLAVAAAGGVRLWLHGHRHAWYVLPAKAARAPFVSICTGSATQAGIAGYNEYTITGTHLEMVRRTFDPAARSFRDEPAIRVELAP